MALLPTEMAPAARAVTPAQIGQWPLILPIRDTVTKPLHPALSRDLGVVLHKEKVRERGLRVFTEELDRLRSGTTA